MLLSYYITEDSKVFMASCGLFTLPEIFADFKVSEMVSIRTPRLRWTKKGPKKIRSASDVGDTRPIVQTYDVNELSAMINTGL